MKYKLFPTPFFKHFIQPSPSIAKSKFSHVVLRGQIPHKNGPIPLWFAPIKLLQYLPPSPLNMATMIRQHTKFPPTARCPRQT